MVKLINRTHYYSLARTQEHIMILRHLSVFVSFHRNIPQCNKRFRVTLEKRSDDTFSRGRDQTEAETTEDAVLILAVCHPIANGIRVCYCSQSLVLLDTHYLYRFLMNKSIGIKRRLLWLSVILIGIRKTVCEYFGGRTTWKTTLERADLENFFSQFPSRNSKVNVYIIYCIMYI